MSLRNLFILIYIGSCMHLSHGQQLNDEATSRGLDFVYSVYDHWGVGFSSYDYNNDGWDDLTFVIPNDFVRFYRNLNGQFEYDNISLPALGDIRSLIWCDIDNDGQIDIVAAYKDLGLKIFRNTGGFQFFDVTAALGITTIVQDAYCASVADINLDGYLDIYVSAYSLTNGNRLFLSDGNGMYTDETVSLGFDTGYRTTFITVFYDYNRDGSIDIHVANDRYVHDDELFMGNTTSGYTDYALSLGLINPGNPMTLSIADYNNDGYEDAFLSDFGNDLFFSGVSTEQRVYRNNSGLNSTLVTSDLGLETNSFAWGGLWVDYNNDQYEDLYIATGELVSYHPITISRFFENGQGDTLIDVSDSINGNTFYHSYSPIKGDFDRNGFYDIAITNENSYPTLLMNAGNGNNYIKVTLEGTESNRDAIGAIIELYNNGTKQTKTVFGAIGICSQYSQHQIIGLGGSAQADSLVITYPQGIKNKYYNISAGSELHLIEHEKISIFNQDSVYLCAGEEFQIGYAGLVDYYWSSGETTDSIQIQTSGDYYLIGYSSTGLKFISDTLHVEILDLPIYNWDVVLPNCIDQNSGSIQLVEINPDNVFDTLIWSNGMIGDAIQGLGEGWYYLNVANEQCYYEQYDSIYLFNPSGVGLVSQVNHEDDIQLGEIHLSAIGGTPPFQFFVNGSMTNADVYDLSAGIYNSMVLDAEGCMDSTILEVLYQGSAGIHGLGNDIVFLIQKDRIIVEGNVTAYNLAIHDILGRNVKPDLLEKNHDRLEVTILTPGVYYLDLISNSNRISYRVYIN